MNNSFETCYVILDSLMMFLLFGTFELTPFNARTILTKCLTIKVNLKCINICIPTSDRNCDICKVLAQLFSHKKCLTNLDKEEDLLFKYQRYEVE